MADNRYKEYDDSRDPSSYDGYNWDYDETEASYGPIRIICPLSDSDYGDSTVRNPSLMRHTEVRMNAMTTIMRKTSPMQKVLGLI